MRIRIHFDGACDNNSDLKVMGLGVAVFVDNKRAEQYDRSVGLPQEGTSNIAEFQAAIQALMLAASIKKEHSKAIIYLYGDSQLIVNQLKGLWNCNQPHLQDLLKEALRLYSFGNVQSIHWVPRTQNKEADVLSKLGLLKAYNLLKADKQKIL